MKNSQSIRRSFKSRMDAKQDIWRAIPALMGDGSGTIEVPGQPGYVYIRVGNGDLGQAFNNRCPLADDLAIYVGYDPITDPDRRIFQVLSVRMADYAASGNSNIYPNVANHHTTHEFGGSDDVYINWRRLMGFRVGRPSGFVVTIDSGVIFRAGAWTVLAAQTLDLTASKPVGLQERYILITLNAAGVATATEGTAAAGADVTSTPIPVAGHIPLASVRLYGTQTEIGDTPTAPDIFDLRFPPYTVMGSSSAILYVTTRVTSAMSPYTILATDEIVYCDTDGGAITANLPAGIDGKHYKVINCGSSVNNVTLDPNGVEQIYGSGAGVAITLFDSEVVDLHFETTENWW